MVIPAQRLPREGGGGWNPPIRILPVLRIPLSVQTRSNSVYATRHEEDGVGADIWSFGYRQDLPGTDGSPRPCPSSCSRRTRIKETLFDTLGGGDREWSRKLGTAAFELLRSLADSHLRAGQSVVVEANFQLSYQAPWIARVRREYDVDLLELHCHTDLETALRRIARRDDSGERHAAHRAGDALAELRDRYHLYGPLTTGDGLILIDTTDFAGVDYVAIEERVRSSIAWSG